MKHCMCCGVEVAAECPGCESNHTRAGVLEFVWNGYLAKRVEVGWCHKCDLVWLENGDGSRVPICSGCRERLLAVDVTEPRPAIAAAA
jgi:hypothetical protein